MYNGNTNCDRAWLHTWISDLPWQLTLRVKHLQLSMLTHADVIGSKVWPTKINTDKRHFEENCQVLLPTLVSGLTLLSCDLPDHMSAEISIEMGAPFRFQCCFRVNQCRILSQINRSISKTQIHICQLHRTLKTSVI